MSILVVDDQVVNRVLLSRLLTTFNFPVLEATNGQEGLQLFSEHRLNICMVFLDLVMPVLDGWKTALLMRQIEEKYGCQVPIVAYTSEDITTGSPLWARCIESGMNECVPKPIDKTYMNKLLARYVPFWAAPPLPPPPTTCTTSRGSSCCSSLDLGSPGRRAAISRHSSHRASLDVAASPQAARDLLQAVAAGDVAAATVGTEAAPGAHLLR